MFGVIATISLILFYTYGVDATVSDNCLKCLCEANTRCNTSFVCDGEVCGKYRMSWGYWADGGKPTLEGNSPSATTAFRNCAIDDDCSARAVRGYMDKYKLDCDENGVVDCDDYASIHYLGIRDCGAGLPLDHSYTTYYYVCKNILGHNITVL